MMAVCLFFAGLLGGHTVLADEHDALTAQEMQGATEVSLGGQGTHAWGADDTPLLARVVLPADGMLTAQITKTTHNTFGVLDMRYFLYDASGKYICYYKDEEDSRLTAQWKCGLAAGTYYIRAEVSNWSSGAPVSTYNFSFVSGNYYEKEMNNTKETATPIVTDQVYIGELGTGFSNIESDEFRDNCDVYKVELKKGWTYRVETGNLQGTTMVNFLSKDMKLGEMFDLGVDKNVVAPYTGTYYIQIYNYSNDQYEYTVDVKTVAPIATSLTKVKAGKKTLTATWRKQDVDGYEISYATNKKFSKAKVVKVTAKKKSAVIKKLTSKKTYYVRVRTYRKIGGKKYYSKWSKVKSVKIK